MPELPEVETIRIQMEQHLVGQTIDSIRVNTASVVKGNTSSLIHSSIHKARRFSKLLVLDTSSIFSIAVHLKMTGKLIFDNQSEEISRHWDIDYSSNKHTHVDILFTSKSHLYFNDYRRFGTVEILPTSNVPTIAYIQNLGKEFFADLHEKEFLDVLSSTARPIKTVLLDQGKLAGVGNIYANEGLWMSQIHPEASAKTINPTAAAMLFQALERVMSGAIRYGGASSENFRNLFGIPGEAQNHFHVYGKEDAPCERCRHPISKIFLGGRGTYYCSSCQKI